MSSFVFVPSRAYRTCIAFPLPRQTRLTYHCQRGTPMTPLDWTLGEDLGVPSRREWALISCCTTSAHSEPRGLISGPKQVWHAERSGAHRALPVLAKDGPGQAAAVAARTHGAGHTQAPVQALLLLQQLQVHLLQAALLQS